MIRRALAILALVYAGACGAGQKTGRPPAAAGPIAEVARHVPARVTYALFFARTDAATGMIRDLMTPFGAAAADVSPQQVDSAMRASRGFSLIDAADLMDQGVDVSRPLAIFSTDYLPTLLVPIGDAGKVTAAIGKLVGDGDAVVSEHRGVKVTSIHGAGVTFAQLDRWVAVRVGERSGPAEDAKRPPLDWLDEIIDAGPGVDAGPALALAGDRRDAVGWIDGEALLAKLSKGECTPPDALERLTVAATLTDGVIDGAAVIELDPETALAVSRHTAAAPDGPFLAARAGAAVALSMSVDLNWLGGRARAWREPCGLVDDLVRETDLDELDNVQPGVTSFHLAVLGATMAGRDLDLDAMLWLGAGDEAAVRTWLDFLFPPDARGHEQIAGIDVDSYRLDVLPLAEPLRFVLGGGALRLTSGRGVMDKLLGQASVMAEGQMRAGIDAGAQELAFVQLLPDAMPDTRPAGELLVISGRMQEEDMRGLSLFFASLKRLVLSATLESGKLRLAGRLELR